ncbi:MAG: hypothetical protein GY799_18665, partial [Desulfobulbaceae bacterium]|nr:hypothetical protein [Desulfobulbaceae bacterium]
SGVVDDLNAHLLIIKSVVVDPPVVNVAGGFSVKGVLDEGNNLDETQYQLYGCAYFVKISRF